jgi:hypothetical protein
MIGAAMRLSLQPIPLPPSDGKLTGREWLVLVLGALALTVLVVVVEPGTFGSTDWIRMHSFYKAYCQSSVAQGRLPLWNPHHWLGRPFLADIESAFFYPPEWLYLILEVHLACALTCALHYLLLLYGTVKLARALGAEKAPSFFVAFVFAASAPIVGCFTSGLVHYGQALCFAPWVLYLGMRMQAGPHRRDVGLLALTLGLQVLCGHPQAAWLTEVGLAVFLVGRRLAPPWRSSAVGAIADLAGGAGAVALGLGLAAVALLPLAELAGQGNRPEPSLAFASLLSEPSHGWATLLVPTKLPFFAFQANAQLYAGLVALVAGLCGLSLLRDRNLLCVFSALLAAGDATPIFGIFFHTIPGVGWLRIHSRATVLVTLGLVLAAGLSLSRKESRGRTIQAAVTAAAAGLVAAGFCLRWPGYGSTAVTAALWRVLLAAATGVVVVLWTRTPRESASRRQWLAGAIALVTVFDLGAAGLDLKRDNRAADPADFAQRLHAMLSAQGLLGAGKVPPRVFLPGPCENCGMTGGWSSVEGYSALAPGRVWRHMHEVLGISPPFRVNTFPSLEIAERGPFPYQSMAMVIGIDPRSKQVVYNPSPDPRAYLVTAGKQVRDDREATRLMREGHDFHAVALVEQPVGLPDVPTAVEGGATITSFAPERIVVGVTSPVPALLVLAEPWFPGWSAEVNGTQAPCIPANAWMRAVPVPVGKSEVVLTFRSTYLARGAALSVLALAIIAALMFRRRPVPRSSGRRVETDRVR